jgi:prolyl-tRNA editing enzyme YbaK/EbsC (Cys-tRNA(Pro) deacylase)
LADARHHPEKPPAPVSQVTLAGASAKEVQILGRHATPSLTMNTYGRARNERHAEVAEGKGLRNTTGAQRGKVLALSDGRKQSCVVDAAGIEPASNFTRTDR